MARLGARGRTELVRLSKEETLVPKKAGDTDWIRFTWALMSDGTVLRKHDVRFTASSLGAAYKHSFGWKRFGKFNGTAAEFTAKMTVKGYQVER